MIDLHDDIIAVLRAHALGRENAMPRNVLRAHLQRIGRTVSDRAMRRCYAEIPQVGFAIDGKRRGLFWIRTRDEAKMTEALLRAHGVDCLGRAAETRVAFGIAFANIEASVVVYLRHIFHPGGFNFPMTVLGQGAYWKRFLFTEIGREAATMVLLLTTCWLAGRNRPQRFAYFLTLFAIWDIFYYVWLKVLINWPATIMDWDILFLIPVTWASPVLYPVLISVVLLIWAAIILYRDSCGRPLRPTLPDWLAFGASGLIIVASFCIVGVHVTEQGFESYFYLSLFAAGFLLGILTFAKCCLRSGQKVPETSV